MTTDTKIQWAHHTASPWHGCDEATLPDGTDHPGCLHCYARELARRNPGTLGVWGDLGTRIRDKSFHKNCAKWDRAAAAAGERHRVFPSICDPFEDWSGEYGDRHILDSKGRVFWRDEISGLTFIPGDEESQKIEPGSARLRYLTMDHMRSDLFRTIDRCTNLDFLLLTKRPQNVRKMLTCSRDTDGDGDCEICAHGDASRCKWRHNVWLLYSASDQKSLDAGAEQLLRCQVLCPLVGLSLEPLVGPVPHLFRWLNNHDLNSHGQPVCTSCFLPTNRSYAHYPVACWNCGGKLKCGPRIGWVIVGGESGHGARPCDIKWIREIVAQCKAAGVPCFVKQLGSNAIDSSLKDVWCNGEHHYTRPVADPDGVLAEAGKKPAYSVTPHKLSRLLTDKKGGDPAEWPEDLRVREMPRGVA